MQGRFQIFEAILERRRRGAWRWKVCSAEGDVIVRGFDISRRAAGYNANRALFQLLLSAPYHSKRLSSLNSPSPCVLGDALDPVRGCLGGCLATSSQPASGRWRLAGLERSIPTALRRGKVLGSQLPAHADTTEEPGALLVRLTPSRCLTATW